MIDRNATAAYKRAGYTGQGHCAESAASRMLRNVEVKTAIEQACAVMSQAAEITAEQIIEEYRRIAFVDPRAVFEWGPNGVTVKDSASLPPEVAACIAEANQTVTEAGGTIRVKLHDKLNALDRLAKIKGLFVDRHEHSGPGGKPVPVTFIEIPSHADDRGSDEER